MKCSRCKRTLRPGDQLIPVVTLVGNERRGDFVSDPKAYVHLMCIPEVPR
jgi:hypothetical protein